MKYCLTFADVNIEPKFSTVPSREVVNLSVNRPGFPYVTLPVISANMSTITEARMSQAMGEYGALSCLHRFQSISDNVKMFEESYNRSTLVSIGLGMKELERAEALRDAGAFTFVIDVNHGANISVVNQARQLRAILGKDFGIIVGNFATGKSIETFLEHSGPGIVDGAKINIGGGSVCLTRQVTAVGIPQLSALLDCRPVIERAGITMIADGCMKTAGDVCKAIATGAHFVMTGGMLAGCEECPGEIVNERGQPLEFLNDGTVKIEDWITHPTNVKLFKKYSGSASRESYIKQGKVAKHRAVEGESFLVPYKGLVAYVLQDIEGGLRGSLSMVGAYTIEEYHRLAEFVEVSSASAVEAGAHNSGKKL